MLFVVALPIGNTQDITLRALELLKTADVIIGEERKVVIPLLKSYGVDIQSVQIEFLNEHSKKDDITEFKTLCREKNVVLVSDCGTPVFCDPGSQLIQACRTDGIGVRSAPGASSLMTILSLSSKKLETFYFYGFLPREKEDREKEIIRISTMKESVVVMDTPYRLKATIDQLAKIMPGRIALLGCDLTAENETVIEGSLKQINSQLNDDKREFILLIY